jgi:hypothetical protein
METPEKKKVKKVKRLTVEDKSLNEIIKQDQQAKDALFEYEKEVNIELDKLKVNKLPTYIEPTPISNKKKYILRTEKGEIIERFLNI